MTADQLLEVVGLDGFLRLAAVHGGGRLYISREADPSSALGALLGPEVRARLADRCAGQRVEVPALDGFITYRTRAVAHLMAQAGYTPRQLAALLDVSENRARELAAEGATFSPALRVRRNFGLSARLASESEHLATEGVTYQ